MLESNGLEPAPERIPQNHLETQHWGQIVAADLFTVEGVVFGSGDLRAVQDFLGPLSWGTQGHLAATGEIQQR